MLFMKHIFILTFYFLRALSVLATPGGAKSLIAENIMLRKQLITLSRRRKRAPNLSQWNRLFFAFLTAIINPKRLLKTAIAIKPSLLIKFHKALIKRKYSTLFSRKSKRKPGPADPSQELIQAILAMKQRNPRFGCRRIAMQVNNTFCLDINKDVVWRILAKYYKPTSNDDGPSWLTFIGNMKDSLWSIDLFRCESILLKSHWVMVLMDQYTRRIIGFAVHPGTLDGITICMLFNKIISGKNLPKYLSSGNDPILQFHRWKANLRILEIEEIKSLPYLPMSHPFVERLIRTCRNEVIDRIIFWNETDLQRKLDEFQRYFNENRTHMGLSGKIPRQFAENKNATIINIKNYIWKSYCRGLFQLPIAA
jgi:putative transposase